MSSLGFSFIEKNKSENEINKRGGKRNARTLRKRTGNRQKKHSPSKIDNLLNSLTNAGEGFENGIFHQNKCDINDSNDNNDSNDSDDDCELADFKMPNINALTGANGGANCVNGTNGANGANGANGGANCANGANGANGGANCANGTNDANAIYTNATAENIQGRCNTGVPTEDKAIENFAQLSDVTAGDYYKQYVPYYNQVVGSTNMMQAGGNRDDLMKKLNYMIHLLEEQQDEKTNNVTEELVLYLFLGVFVIFIVDSFARAGKYTR